LNILWVSETAILAEATKTFESGAQAKLKIEAKALGKTFEMTAIFVSEEEHEGKKGIRFEFVRANPAHKRLIASYLSGKSAA
jgi:hypothetical protein